MKQIVARPHAARDIESAFWWYESQRSGLGVEFREADRRSLLSISENPAQYAVLYHKTRRALLRRFSYMLLYRELETSIVVVACFHGRRDPRRWTTR